MTVHLNEILSELKKYKPYTDNERPKVFKFINNYVELVSVLTEIQDKIIGLDSYKNKIADQFKYFVVNYHKIKTPLHGNMLNAVFYGPPGVGKTECAKLLARFWHAVGVSGTGERESDYLSILEGSNKLMQYENKLLRTRLEELSIDAVGIKTSVNRLGRKNGSKVKSVIEIRHFINKVQESCVDAVLPDLLVDMHKIEVKSPRKETKFVVLTRADIVEKYQGHTAKKVKELVNKYSGGVIMIDEAYNLCNGMRDTYGLEALTEICATMDRDPNKIRWIFAGYKDKIVDGIFKYQPGLPRRFNWKIELKSYNARNLSRIFRMQMKRNGLIVSDLEFKKISPLFNEYNKVLDNDGGSTKNLCYLMANSVKGKQWLDAIKGKELPLNYSYNSKMVRKMLETMLEEKGTEDTSYLSMYV
uniref:ATPase family protein n=1 Tax=Pithovirus LCDPAC01 TaxID=2506600 RepID=A0A481YNS5_9VIRU|nr:MAG: ATPase family protein [Pithovirus LCDPAC01]